MCWEVLEKVDTKEWVDRRLREVLWCLKKDMEREEKHGKTKLWKQLEELGLKGRH